MKFFFIAVLCFLTLTPPSLAAEEPEEVSLEPIILNVTKTPIAYAKTSRNVQVIDGNDIRNAAASSIEQLLRDRGGLEIRHRGPHGVQADVSIRGSTYSQNVVLVNGIRVSDPQTAHHSLDLGLTLESIEKIEILPGHGSSLYGADAFGGVINIVTKKPETRRIVMESSYGNEETIFSNCFVSDYWKNIGGFVSFENRESNGYRFDTDFKITTLTTALEAAWEEKGSFDFLFGYTEKEFGANDFYAAFPSKEWTQTYFATAGLNLGEDIILQPRMFYRRHYDKFILSVIRPDFFRNDHVTDLYGIEGQCIIPFARGNLLMGAEASQDEIESSNLGNHRREHFALFVNGNADLFEKVMLDGGLRIDDHTDFKIQYSPSAGLAYSPFAGFKVRSSIGRSFRIPSYTELFYDSPANRGNENLNPEKATSYEMGVDYGFREGSPYDVSMTVFRREEKDLIDWIKSPPSAARYETQNITSATVEGLESRVTLKPWELVSAALSYSYIDTDVTREGNYTSKYALHHPAHQVNGTLDITVPFGTQRVTILYKDRKLLRDYFLTDLHFSAMLKEGVKLYLDVLNVFDEDYEEIQGVPMPGSSFRIGLKTEF
jgi:iron complex outermembrane receptor protein